MSRFGLGGNYPEMSTKPLFTSVTSWSALALSSCIAFAGCDDAEYPYDDDIQSQAAGHGSASADALRPGTDPSPAAVPIPTCSTDVYVGDYYIETQADLDALNNYAKVEGDVVFYLTDIVDIVGVDCLEEITGDLAFTENGYAQTVSGFAGLTTIGGTMDFLYNGFQTSAQFSVSGFDNLESLDKISITSSVNFYLDGLDNLETLGSLGGSESTNIYVSGLNSLETLGNINFTLTYNIYIDGLTALETITGAAKFIEPSGVYLDGLANLESIGGALYFYEVSLYPETTALPSLESLGSFYLRAYGNTVTDFAGLDALESINGSLTIDGANFQTLSAFGALQTVGGSLNLWELYNLTEITGLDELAKISGNLTLAENESLTELGLGELSNVGGNVVIIDNTALSTCDAQALVDQLSNLGGSVTISGNGSC
ncbi:hypothetical protein G6O69_03850 [Pseudenhygromyxa sp. WMMC2535]|uniref:hypothetical protein n=1 Tax=Pseudenhygromyxa sp. WMMC2535 TaxID=2712867 RepID=UPI0015551338|nr:hypothetical protein [Pseudenhygromyxa sp. WMMC2535]NVB36949.1 hypothetical protein [Pseudenhygromyxa sp. WMMC2535]